MLLKKMNWEQYIHEIRKQEIELVFQAQEGVKYDLGLELGAGDGYQSRLLIKHINKLICTELNSDRLIRRNINGIEYKICNAEKIDSYFKNNQFDLVFSSNMFEHLPNPELALRGIKKILKNKGQVILIMPSPLWALIRFIIYYPNYLIYLSGKLLKKLLKIKRSSKYSNFESGIEQNSSIPLNFYSRGNNLLMERDNPRVRFWDVIRWPRPHGVQKNIRKEILAWRQIEWMRLFQEEGFLLENIRRGPLFSGYGFGFKRLRKLLYILGFSSENIYYLGLPDSREL